MNAFSCPHCGRFIGKEPHGPGYCTPESSAANEPYDEAEVATRGTPFMLASRPPGFKIVGRDRPLRMFWHFLSLGRSPREAFVLARAAWRKR